jgi:ADP-ribosylglycohydrolase
MNINNINKTGRRNALWLGSIVGDAFVLGGHWIYDVEKLKSSFPDYNKPQNPLPGTYHKSKKLGDQTHYGDQARHLWQFLSENNGIYDPDRYREAWLRFMNRYDGYMDGASRETISALQSDLLFGSGSDELGGTARIAAIYYWLEDAQQAIISAIDQSRMTHDSRQATAITVLIASALQTILDKPENESQLSVFETLNMARIQMVTDDEYDMNLINEAFDTANSLQDFTAEAIAENLGQSCHAKHALPVILAVLKHTEDYQEAMKLNVMIGGDSATRAMIIGALLGAKYGIKVIPQEWIDVIRD